MSMFYAHQSQYYNADFLIYYQFCIFIQVLGPIHFIARGRLEGQVYTNGWPKYSAVVCQYKGTTTQWVSIY